MCQDRACQSSSVLSAIPCHILQEWLDPEENADQEQVAQKPQENPKGSSPAAHLRISRSRLTAELQATQESLVVKAQEHRKTEGHPLSNYLKKLDERRETPPDYSFLHSSFAYASAEAEWVKVLVDCPASEAEFEPYHERAKERYERLKVESPQDFYAITQADVERVYAEVRSLRFRALGLRALAGQQLHDYIQDVARQDEEMWGDVFSIHDDFNDLKIDIDHLEYYLSNPECSDEQSHTRQEQEGRRQSRLRESLSASDLDDVEVRRITRDMVNLRLWSQLSPTHTRVKAIKSVAMKPPGPIAEMITVRCFN